MDIRLYQEFLVVVQHMNISHAATKLHLSQPALSRHIAEFEKGCGQKLFSRKRPLSLTRAGEIVLKRASEITNSHNQLKMELDELRKSVSGTIRVHDFSYYQYSVFVNAIHRVEQLYPNVRVELVGTKERTVLEDLMNGNADVTFVFKGGADAYVPPQGDNQFGYKRVGVLCDRLVVGVGKKHRLASKKSLELADLDGEWIVRPSDMLFDSPSLGFIELCKAHGIRPKYRLLQSETVQQFWRQDFSESIFIFAESTIREGLFPLARARQVKVFEPLDADLDWCMFSVFLKDIDNPAVLAFVELLNEDELDVCIGHMSPPRLAQNRTSPEPVKPTV
jgi:DNA-binding transcriptional LysR family regulator